MSKRMKQCRGDLQLLGECRPSTRKLILKHCDDKLIQAISNAVYTTLAQKVSLSPQQQKPAKEESNYLEADFSKEQNVQTKEKSISYAKGRKYNWISV